MSICKSTMLAATAAVFLLAQAADAHGQLFGGFGGGNRSGGSGFGGYQQRGQYPSSGQWGSRGEGSSSSSNSGDWRPWVQGVIEGLGRIPNTPPRQDYYPQRYPSRRRTVPSNRTQPRTATPQNKVVSQVTPIKNDADFALTGAEQQFSEEAQESTAKVGDEAADKLKDKMDPNVDAAVDAAQQTGDTSKLQDMIDDGTLAGDDKTRAEILIATTEANKDLAGGLSADRYKDKLGDIENLVGKLPAGERGPYLDALDEAKVANNNQKVAEVLAANGGLGGGVGLGGIDPATLDGPFYVDDPVADEDGASLNTGKSILINPKENGESVSYVLGNNTYTLKPGFVQKLSKTYTIRFHPGGKAKEKKYKLPDGTYNFVISEKGWDLKKATYDVTINNSDYAGEFNYVADNKSFSLEPGENRLHESDWPVVVRFDRGNGEEAVKELDSGTFKVGIDLNQQRLDLFEDTGKPRGRLARSSRSRTGEVAGAGVLADLPIDSAAARRAPEAAPTKSDDGALNGDLLRKLQKLTPEERKLLLKLLEDE